MTRSEWENNRAHNTSLTSLLTSIRAFSNYIGVLGFEIRAESYRQKLHCSYLNLFATFYERFDGLLRYIIGCIAVKIVYNFIHNAKRTKFKCNCQNKVESYRHKFHWSYLKIFFENLSKKCGGLLLAFL